MPRLLKKVQRSERLTISIMTFEIQDTTKLKSKCISAIATQRSLRWSLIYFVLKNVDPHVWSQARIRMYTDRRDRGEWKKRVIFPLVTIAASPLDFRRKQQQKNPSGTQGIRGYAAPGNFWDFDSLKSPFISWDPKSFKQDIDQFHSPRIKPCNLESFFFIKNVSIM